MSHDNKQKSSLYEPEKGYDLYAKFYDERSQYLDSFEQGRLKEFLGDLKGKKILDAACGTGRSIPLLVKDGAEVTGIDISEEMIKIAQKNFPQGEFVKGDIENLPFADKSFDLVVALFAIVHLKDTDRFFQEVYRVLKEGGNFVLSNVNQRKAPKLRISGSKKKESITIESYYHMPQHLAKSLDNAFFKIEKDEFIYENGVWINQIILACK